MSKLVTLKLNENQLQILRAALTQSRAEWCKKSTDALLARDMDKFDTVSAIYAQTCDLDQLICSAK